MTSLFVSTKPDVVYSVMATTSAYPEDSTEDDAYKRRRSFVCSKEIVQLHTTLVEVKYTSVHVNDGASIESLEDNKWHTGTYCMTGQVEVMTSWPSVHRWLTC